MLRRLNMSSPTNSGVVNTTIQLENTLFTNPCPWNWMFIPEFFHRNLQHLVPNQLFLHFQIMGWSSWHLWTNEYEAIDLQIEQGWIQKKDVHIFYQLQVVFVDVYIEVALGKPRKWSTQAWLWHLFFKNHHFFFMFSHLKAS